jgi:hypothetical protein
VSSPARWKIELETPPEWFSLVGDRAVDEAEVSRRVASRVKADRSLKVYGQAMAEAALEWSDVAATQGAAFAAWRWGLHPTFGFAMSSLLAHRLQRDPGPAEDGLAPLAELLGVERPSDEFPPRIDEVQLRMGRAVRMHAVREPPPEEGQPQHLRLVVEYWLPLWDADLVQMSFTTSNLALASELAAEYEGIAQRLTLAVED